MPSTEWGWEIAPHELTSWILRDDEDLLVINKPALVVCHPSKNGPMSSLVGACRPLLGGGKTRLVARLDRETSGLILFAKRGPVARELQMALERRAVSKTYLAILEGELLEPTTVVGDLAKDPFSPVHCKNAVTTRGRRQSATTRFTPLHCHEGRYTLARVDPLTGRKHQIRVHAEHHGNPIVGDKLYGPDETLFLEFIENGWTERLAEALPLNRQALHAFRMTFHLEDGDQTFVAPPPEDFRAFCKERLALSEARLDDLLEAFPADPRGPNDPLGKG